MSFFKQSYRLPILLFLVISGSAFTVFAFCSAVTGWVLSDGAILYDLDLLPKRLLLQQFLTGLLQSLVVTIPLGLLAVLDYSLVAQLKPLRKMAGLTLPLVILAVGFWWYQGDWPTLVALAMAGLLLWLLFRLTLLFGPRRA